ncbi:MAG: chemotaxis protein CheW [Burkholderiaceae bacterium]|nr:chemotaxis protein CheW [Burkholderiaceae bacterium]
MSNKEALRELQHRLAERMQAARSQAPGNSWLAVECGGHDFLLALQQAGEIFPVPAITPVPHTQAWLAGVANLRGGLYAVVDLGGFLGLRQQAPARNDQSRLVAVNAKLDINCALLVDRLAGLRNSAELTPVEAPADAGALPPFVGRRLQDGQGRVWQELLLQALVVDEHFLSIVA